jgi:phosphoglycerol transferase MdoB-like AlkP superfamily enzyme
MEKSNYLKRILFWLLLGLAASLLAHLIIEGLQRIGFTDTWLPVQFFVIGTGILFIIYTFFSSLLGSATLGGISLILTAVIIGSINRSKIHYRAEPLFPSDFIIVKEVPFLVEMIGWFYATLILIAIGLGIALFIRFYQTKIKPRKEENPWRFENLLRVIGLCVSSLALIYLSQFPKADHALQEFYLNQTDWTFEQQVTDYQKNGFIAGFLAYIEGEPMAAPKDYSKEKAAEIYAKYSERADALNQNKEKAATDTNILFVMNESFSDPFNLEGLESNHDPLIHFREITNETLSGQVLSPTFGGGTDTNEFQALTGFSLEPLNPQITSPYMQLNEKIETYPTIVRHLNNLDYRTTAIHPYDKDFFRRAAVYEKMGFDMFLHKDNMANREKVSADHLFISDASTYKEAFEVLHASDEPDFIHVVTMQNHTPYAEKYEEIEYEVWGSGNSEEAAGYFEDLENSDEALRELIKQIEQHPEPILMIFWGDHLPGLYRGEIRERNDEVTLRQTPFLVYSNTKDLKGKVSMTSPIYFRNWIYDWLEIDLTAYDALLLALEEVLPALDKGIYWENNRQLTSRTELSSEAVEVLAEYSMILYDITTGQQYAHQFNFFE